MTLLCLYGQAQEFRWGFDTNYVTRYNERLAMSIFQSQRTFELNFEQTGINDPQKTSVLKYIARSNKATGISLSYDKISFSLAYTTPLPETEIARKGKTKYSDYGISFTGNKYRLELSYRNYKGFYENNTYKYDSLWTSDTSVYYKRPDMNNLVLKTKFFYFFNKKRRFSYNAAYYNTYRQLKSAGSFFVYSDAFYNSITDPEGFFSPQVDSFYSDYKRFNFLEAYGLTLGGGYTFNLVVWKSLYFNGTMGLAGQFYQQNTKTADEKISREVFKAGLTGADVRWVLGYNGKNFFIRGSFNVDITVYKLSEIRMTAQLISGTFALGYRFKFKERNWVKKMKENKFYKML